MKQLLAIVAVLLLLLNTIVSAIVLIWLVVLGNWGDIGKGIVWVVVMPFAFSLASVPRLAMIWACTLLAERGFRTLALFLGWLSFLYLHLLIIGWVVVVCFEYEEAVDNRIPRLLWGWAVVTTPLMFMAKFETDDPYTSLLLFLVQIAYLGLVVCILTGTGIIPMAGYLALLVLLSTAFSLQDEFSNLSAD